VVKEKKKSPERQKAVFFNLGLPEKTLDLKRKKMQ